MCLWQTDFFCNRIDPSLDPRPCGCACHIGYINAAIKGELALLTSSSFDRVTPSCLFWRQAKVILEHLVENPLTTYTDLPIY